MNPTLQMIRTLLENDMRQLARLGENVLSAKSRVLTSVEIPLKNARDIYYRRARLNADEDGSIQGFNELVPSLERETDDVIGIQSIEGNGLVLLVFTNTDVTRLIGLLVVER